jgi:UDP-4-amino-4,6-dideoxy-N-acetyl-beta-L-altrosamine transaminase
MTVSQPLLPYARYEIDEEDIAAVANLLRSGAPLTDGPAVDAFEASLAKVCGAKEAVACSSGTTALHLMMLALGIKEGDQVIVPTITFLATANAVRFVGAEVIFADADPTTGLMTPANFEEALSRAAPGKVKAVIPVHMNGQCCDMRGIVAIAKTHNIAVIEDACHAIGGTYPGNESVPVGGLDDVAGACFSFHPVKAFATGEGGAISCADPVLAEKLRVLRCHGMEKNYDDPLMKEFSHASDGTPNPWFYEMPELGWNFRLSDIQCALGNSQLKKLPAFLARRTELMAAYEKALKPLAPVIQPVRRVGGQPGWHLNAVLVDFPAIGMERAHFVIKLRAEGIGVGVQYLPVHLQPYYQRLYGRRTLAGAEAYYSKCISLPLFPAMTDADVDHVVAAVRKVAGL